MAGTVKIKFITWNRNNVYDLFDESINVGNISGYSVWFNQVDGYYWMIDKQEA